jgi:hypothetical protein
VRKTQLADDHQADILGELRFAHDAIHVTTTARGGRLKTRAAAPAS